MDSRVLIVRGDKIRSLNISAKECVRWVEESFRMKYDAQLPAKISVHPKGNDFYTSMPCLLPIDNQFGIKVVSRIAGRIPTLSSEILLYDGDSGHLVALLDGDWITTMRTGAVAALSIKTFQKTSAKIYSIVGLGNTARATLLCLLDLYPNKQFHFRLLKYKEQADLFIERFAGYPNIVFEIVNDIKLLIKDADVIISCITDASELLCADDSLYKEGVLLVPVHTRGFQNCDLFFDKVYADDTEHVKGFQNFKYFKSFDEFSHVLLGKNPGRENDKERIIAYNIGLGLHDIVFAQKIYNKVKVSVIDSFTFNKENEKFWV
jgi:ornithine cyclodeaminase